MNEPEKKRNRLLAEQLLIMLRKRNMDAYFCETGEEARKKVLELIPEGGSVTWGGSESIKEIGLPEALKNGGYKVFDRTEAVSDEEIQKIYREAFFADAYLTSTNAVTFDGELINIDGNANRVAAMAFGPKAVIMVVGMNKVVKDVEEGISRTRNFSAPINVQRLGFTPPCSKTGRCMNCLSPYCICCQILITRYSRIKGRTKVILVNEELGF
ncbi:MAG: lactate utilization protein [Firmicutes bacterium]|nr:lactate utilization protein [Bacillota bacterium]